MKKPTETQNGNSTRYRGELNHVFVRAVVVLVAFAGVAGDAIAQTGTYTMEVPATIAWTDTGIDLLAGWQLSVTATGLATYDAYEIGGPLSTNANGGDVSGNNFFSDAVYPDTEIHSLIGKIGGTTNVGTGVAVPGGLAGYGVGFVGESYSERMTTNGTLFLGYNDEVPDFYDNSGGFSVTITVVPEPSTLALVGLGTLLFVRRRGRGGAAGGSPIAW
jgi:hypothetical protein